MIEFKGLISGEAEKHFWNKEKKLGLFAFGAALALFTFVFVAMSIITGDWRFGIAMILMSVIIVVIILVYKPSKKQIEEFNPRRIYIDEDYLVMESLKGEEEAHPISEIVALVDYGEFYDAVCSTGIYTGKFICQKNLLTEGTLEEFEALFEGKIQRIKDGKTE